MALTDLQWLSAIPTASPRTLYCLELDGFIKLHYPFVLGRFSSDLTGDKLFFGPRLSTYMQNLEVPCYLPETGAVELRTGKEGTSGFVFRAMPPSETSEIDFIPAFSVFADQALARSLGLEEILPEQRLSPEAILKLLGYLVEDFFSFCVGAGVLPEGHAQNLVLKHGANGALKWIWRDLQGFWLDRPVGTGYPGGTYHNLTAADETGVKSKRSELFDWVLSEYTIRPIIRSQTPEAAEFVYRELRKRTAVMIEDTVGYDFFPAAFWTAFPLRHPKAGELLKVERKPLPSLLR